jgi:hypothetical protein
MGKFNQISSLVFWSVLFVLGAWQGGVSSAEAQGRPTAQIEEMMRSCMQQAKSDCTDWAAGVLGGELPKGISINTVVELAEREKYYLIGKIVVNGNAVYLQIDFDKQPWLKSEIRTAFPFYRFELSEFDAQKWKKWDLTNVEALVQAKLVTFVSTQEHKILNEMVLVPLQDPSILTSVSTIDQNLNSKSKLIRH